MAVNTNDSMDVNQSIYHEHVTEGDFVLLYCPETSGYLYCEPCSSVKNLATVQQADELEPILCNSHFAVFQVLPAKSSESESNVCSRILAYGRSVKFKHVGSGKCLSISDDLTVCLDSESCDSNIFFRFVSTKSYKGWGKDVFFEERVRIESVAHKRSYVQCSHDALESKYKISLADVGSGFKMKLHRLKSADERVQNCLHGSKVVTLFNEKQEAYLCGYGSFANDCLPNSLKLANAGQIGYRKRKLIKGIRGAPPHSGDTFLQLELADNPLSGDVISYGTECRIKHLATMKYLVVEKNVDGNFEVALKSGRCKQGNDIFIIWQSIVSSTVSSSPPESSILSTSSVTIEHKSTQRILTVKVKRELSHEATITRDSRQWFQLTVVDKDQDTLRNDFKLGEVEDIGCFNCALGFASTIHTLFKKLRQLLEGQLNEQLLQTVTLELSDLLSSLQLWMDNPEGKKKADLIHTLQVLDLILGLIAIIPSTHDGLHYTLSTISLVLEKYVAVADQKSLDYMMEEKCLTPLIQKVATSCGVEKVIMAILKANPNAPTFCDIEEKVREQLAASATQQNTSKVSLQRSYRNADSEEVDELLRVLKYSEVSSDIDSQYFLMQKALIAPERTRQSSRYHPHVYQTLQAVTGKSRATAQRTDTRWELTFNFEKLSLEDLDQCKESIADLVSLLVQDSPAQVAKKAISPVSSDENFSTQLKLLTLQKIRILLKTQLHSTLRRTVIDFIILRHKATRNEKSKGDLPDLRHLLGSVANMQSKKFSPPPDALQKLLKDFTLDKSDANQDKPAINERVIKLATKRMKSNFTKSLTSHFISETKDGRHLSQSLLLLLDSNEQKVQLRSAEYLFDIFSTESILLAELEKSYLVSDETANSDKYKEMVSLGTWQDEKKMLWNIGKKRAAEREELLEVLQRLADYCVMEDNKFLPNSVHQNIAYSCGIFSSVLGYLLQFMSSLNFDNENVVRMSMKLLQAIARSNVKVQKRLFNILHEFLDTKMAISTMANLLNEVFANNPIISSKITYDDIRQILYTALSGGSAEHSELLTVLRTVVKETQGTTGSIIIQDNVTELFSDYWSDCVLSEILGMKNKDYRFEILAKAEGGCEELHLLLNSAFLIAVCCEAGCRTAESLAQELFSLPELLLIIADASIACDRKVPFARMLTFAYLLTESNSGQACATIAKNMEFWVNIEKLDALVLKLLLEVKKLEPLVKKAIQQQLEYLAGRQISVLEWELTTAQAELSIHLMETGDQKKKSESINKTILYLLEGFLPMLSEFCSKVCAHICGQNTECIEAITPYKMKILFEFNKTLQRLKSLRLDTTNFDISSHGSDRTIRSCSNNIGVLLVTVNAEGASGIDLSGTLRERGRRSHQQVCDAVELQLNRELENFVANYQKILPRENEDTESDDPTLTIPRGENYKHLVHLFVDDQASTSSEKPLKIQKLLTLLNSIQTAQQQNLDCHEHTKFDRMLVVSLKVLYSAISQMTSRTLPEGALDQLQKKLLALDPLRKLTKLLKDPRDDIAFYVLACFHLFLSHGGKEMDQEALTLIREQGKELFERIHGMLDRVQVHLRHQKSTILSSALEKDGRAGKRRVSSMLMGQLDDAPSLVIYNPMKEEEVLHEEPDKLEDTEITVQVDIYEEEIVSSSSSSSSLSTLQEDLEVLTTTPVGTGAAAQTDFIDPRISIALDIISRVCDEQERSVQDLLQEEQGFKQSSIIAQLVFLLDHLAKGMTRKELPVALKTVQALTKICFGNFSNQEIAIQGQIVVSVNYLMETHFSNLSDQIRLLELKASAVDLLDALLEETDERSSTVAEWVIADLDQHLLVGAMKDVWLFIHSSDRRTDTSNWNRTLFRAYHSLRRIADHKGITVDQLVTKDGVQADKKMWTHCKTWSRNIEIVYKSHNDQDILTRIYYPAPPTSHLSDSDKETLLNGLNQGKPEEELTDLLRWIKSIRGFHSWKRKLKRAWKTKWIFFANGARQIVLFWLTIALIFFMLFAFDVLNSSTICLPVLLCNEPDVPTVIILACRILHLVLAIWMLVEYYVKTWPTFIFHIPVVSHLLYRLKQRSESKKSLNVIGNFIGKYFCCGRFTIQKPKEPKYFNVHIFSFEPLYRILFTVCSAVGLFFHVYFYTFCLIYILLRNDIIRDILSSVRAAGPQLLTVGILGFVILFSYSVLSFLIYSAVFDPQVGLYCNTLFECFVSVSRIGLLDTLGIDLPLSANGTVPDFTTVAFRTVFDLSFFIIVTLLGFNIVVAILVDQFQHLRQRKQGLSENINNKCLVCSIERDVFERYGQDFRKHVKQEHSLWNYIFFIVYLDGVDQHDQSALEAYVYRQIPKDETYLGGIDFFPILQAKSLPDFHPYNEIARQLYDVGNEL